MLKTLTALSLLALSPLALASGMLPHDPTQCPDLTGTFRMENGAFGTFTFVSYTNASGTPVLSIDQGNGAQHYPLDGKTQDVWGGGQMTTLCHGQVIYDYYTKGGNEPHRTVKWFLDEDRNFILGQMENGVGEKFKGIRQTD